MLVRSPLLLLASAVALQTVSANSPGTDSHALVRRAAAAAAPGEECYTQFATSPDKCPVVNVAFFSDDACRQPANLARQSTFRRGNAEMQFDGAISNGVYGRFGSIKILAAAQGMGVGFAKNQDSDTLVMNMAWMSAADTANAFKSKACITFENLAPGQALFWTARVEDVLNQEGYVWNPWNLPVTSQRCHGSTSSGRGNAQSVCLQRRSWGFGAVLELYESPDCTHRGQRTRQIFNSAQCTPLTMTDFQSFQMIEPRSDQFDMHFSSTYYAIGASGYHACDIRPDTKIRIVPGRCEKMAGKGIYVGVYGVDDRAPPQGPAPGDKVLLRGTLPIAGHRRRRRHSRLGHHGHV